MIGLLQRVGHASVSVNDSVIGQIGRGLLVLVAVHRDDEELDIERLAERILTYRVFPAGGWYSMAAAKTLFRDSGIFSWEN